MMRASIRKATRSAATPTATGRGAGASACLLRRGLATSSYTLVDGVYESPLHSRLEEAGGAFVPVKFAHGNSDHYRAMYFNDNPGHESPRSWFEQVGAECRASRDSMAMLDFSSLSKFMLRGKDAERVLDYIMMADMTGPQGSCVYTQLCDEGGLLKGSLSVSRVADDEFFICTNALTSQIDWDYLVSKQAQYFPDADAELTNLGEQYASLCFQGPRTRSILQPHTKHANDLSADSLPSYTCKKMTVAGVEDCYVLGLSYAGTPGGVEVHCPVGGATRVYDATMPGEMNLGFRGVDAMRAEVNYHLMMHDYPLDFPAFGCTPQFRTKHKGDADFIGKEALKKQIKDGIKTDLMYWTLDDQYTLFESVNGKQPVFADGVEVGYVTSARIGFSVGRGVVIGICDRAAAGVTKKSAWDSVGEWEVEVAPGTGMRRKLRWHKGSKLPPFVCGP